MRSVKARLRSVSQRSCTLWSAAVDSFVALTRRRQMLLTAKTDGRNNPSKRRAIRTSGKVMAVLRRQSLNFIYSIMSLYHSPDKPDSYAIHTAEST